MDITTSQQAIEVFSDPDLVPHNLIENALPKYESPTQLQELHSSASRLLSQLDNHSQDLTLQLEALTAELMRASKKIHYEIELMRSDVSTLIEDMDKVSAQNMKELTHSAQNNTAVDELNKLAKAKKRMEQVQQVFAEAKAFDEAKITSHLIQLLDGGNMSAAQDYVLQTRALCQIWKGTLLYSSRIKFVESLQRQVDVAKKTQAVPETATNSESSADPSRQSSPNPNSDKRADYYGLIGSLQRRMGY
uniref:ARAD1D21362p n=1 Tax=Blastobotrys adeninivorans TaxID=409370 RepID=A0A060TA75_BLAAD